MDIAVGADTAVGIAAGLAALGLLYAVLPWVTGGREEASAQVELIVGVAVAGVAAHFISSVIGISPLFGWAVLGAALFFLAGA